MKTFFQDEFLNKRLLSRMTKQVKQEQLSKVIEEINYLHELQNELVNRYNLIPPIKQDLKK